MFKKRFIFGCYAVAATTAVTLVDKKDKISFDKSYFPYNNLINNSLSNQTSCIQKAEKIVKLYKEECGAPGVSVSVSVNGKFKWSEGFGYSDVENLIPCRPETVMRIASISKAVTSILTGILIDEKKIDLDKDIREYVPEFPEKKFNGKKVTITSRQLLSHTSGVRHYTKFEDVDSKTQSDNIVDKEYYLKEHYNTVLDGLVIFKDDSLHFAPGTGYLYSSPGYNLLSAVLERCSQPQTSQSQDQAEVTVKEGHSLFTEMVGQLCTQLGLKSTGIELNNPLVAGRSRQYHRTAAGKLENVPYVDNSHKWASGGLLSNTPDLLTFGHHLVTAYIRRPSAGFTSVVSMETMRLLWTPVEGTRGKSWYKDGGYGLGWCVVEPRPQTGAPSQLLVSHTGGAVGATSVLLLSIPARYHLPSASSSGSPPTAAAGSAECHGNEPPVVVVAIVANLQCASGIGDTARRVAEVFVEHYTE